MTMFLVTRGIKPADVVNLDPGSTPFPESVIEMLAGGLGKPMGGWPKKLQKVVLGMDELNEAIDQAIDRIRAERKQRAGPGYNLEKDEMRHPIRIDYDRMDLAGVQAVDDRTYTITLKQDFPQLVYWMTMSFFSPMPWEAVRFYQQHAAAEQNVTLQRYPVGTGPYVLTENRPNYRVVLDRNPNFREVRYPSEGSPGVSIMEQVGALNIALQYDMYHMHIMEGDLAHTLTTILPQIAHIQISDSPGRHEPGTGEINYAFLFDFLDRVGYAGWVGCEYTPRTTTAEGLTWFEHYGYEIGSGLSMEAHGSIQASCL